MIVLVDHLSQRMISSSVDLVGGLRTLMSTGQVRKMREQLIFMDVMLKRASSTLLYL